jgi:hypothetical protein
MENTAVKKTTPLLPRTQFLPTGRRDGGKAPEGNKEKSIWGKLQFWK